MNFSLLCRTFVGFVTGTGLQVYIDSGETRAILSIQEKCYFYPVGWVIYLGKGSALPMCREEQQMPSSVAAPYHKGGTPSAEGIKETLSNQILPAFFFLLCENHFN